MLIIEQFELVQSDPAPVQLMAQRRRIIVWQAHYVHPPHKVPIEKLAAQLFAKTSTAPVDRRPMLLI